MYDYGDKIRLSARFTDAATALADPDAVTVKIRRPGGAITTVTGGDIVHDATGRFHYDLLLDAEGQWQYRFEGTGAVTAAAEGQFEVKNSVFY